MQIKVVEATPTDLEMIQAKNDESMPQQSLEEAEPGMIENIAVKQVLELEHNDREYEEEVRILAQWAKAQVGDDPTEMKWAIRDLKMRIGTPTFGDPIKNLARFAYLDLEEKRIKSEKQEFI